jgi:large-conductance mechanosensitive channel
MDYYSYSEDQGQILNKTSKTTDISGNTSPTPTTTQTGFIRQLINFLNSKSGTVFTAAIAMAIGLAFKDFVTAIVNSLIEPLIISIIKLTHLNNYYNFTSFISSRDNALNITKLVQSFFTCVIVVITVYFISQLISPN